MEINVKMTAEEFQEFIAYQADKASYTAQLAKLRGVPKCVAASLSFAVEPVESKPGRFKITSQEHMSDVWDMLEEFMPKKG
ncbi:MAG: hypothetical protein RR350_08295 [Oscillibacter sp.]